MAQFPGMTLWTDSWIADTKHLTRCERGTYLDLLVLMWRTPGCKVPNDNAWLAKHMGMTLAEVIAELRPLLSEFCQTDGNYLHQKRQRHEYARRFELGAAQSVRAKHRRNKKKDISPELAAVSDPAKPGRAKPPYPYPTAVKPSSFPTAATPVAPIDNTKTVVVAKKPQDNPARSLASALPSGALPREPDNEPAEPKKPEEMTLAEINAIRYGKR